jgi:hypothetical protein
MQRMLTMDGEHRVEHIASYALQWAHAIQFIGMRKLTRLHPLHNVHMVPRFP